MQLGCSGEKLCDLDKKYLEWDFVKDDKNTLKTEDGKVVCDNSQENVYSEQIEHTARSFSAHLPLFQCMLSVKQIMPMICLIIKIHISKFESMGHLCRRRLYH